MDDEEWIEIIAVLIIIGFGFIFIKLILMLWTEYSERFSNVSREWI